MKYMLGLNAEELEDNDIVFSMFDGVGMIRGENLCIEKLQYFPIQEFRKFVINYLKNISNQFKGKPVWYRTADLVPHQINLLDGADEIFEEKQFLIGTRGIRRNLRGKEAFLEELSCFVYASKDNPNLGIIIPFVSKVEEMEIVVNLLRNKFEYKGKIGMMLETPASIIKLDEFEKLGLDNYTVGLNDLTTLILGADRDKKEFYSMKDNAVKNMVKYATDKVHSFGKEITVAGYLDQDVVRYCEELGVDNCNIHYDLIPEIFKDIPNPEKFPAQYQTMKGRYDRKKKESQYINKIKGDKDEKSER